MSFISVFTENIFRETKTLSYVIIEYLKRCKPIGFDLAKNVLVFLTHPSLN